MSKDSVKVGIRADEVKQEATYFYQRLFAFVQPLALQLDELLDRRLINTFVSLLGCILRHRHNSLGLLLSELGGKLLGESHSPAGTKRISNLLRSKKWSHSVIEHHLLRQALRLQLRVQLGFDHPVESRRRVHGQQDGVLVLRAAIVDDLA